MFSCAGAGTDPVPPRATPCQQIEMGRIFEVCRLNKEPTTRGPAHLITLNYTLFFMENYKSNCTRLQASSIRFVIFHKEQSVIKCN